MTLTGTLCTPDASATVSASIRWHGYGEGSPVSFFGSCVKMASAPRGEYNPRRVDALTFYAAPDLGLYPGALDAVACEPASSGRESPIGAAQFASGPSTIKVSSPPVIPIARPSGDRTVSLIGAGQGSKARSVTVLDGVLTHTGRLNVNQHTVTGPGTRTHTGARGRDWTTLDRGHYVAKEGHQGQRRIKTQPGSERPGAEVQEQAFPESRAVETTGVCPKHPRVV